MGILISVCARVYVCARACVCACVCVCVGGGEWGQAGCAGSFYIKYTGGRF